MARLHPYDLVFAPALFEEERFPGIREEIEQREAAGGDPEAFLLLGSVGALLRALIPEEQVPREVRGELLRRHGRLLFHAYHYWREGKRTWSLDDASARGLLDGDPRPVSWRLAAPAPAGYVQLPRHLVWARVEEGATPEAVDGFFWTLLGEDAPPAALHLLLVLGLRPDRPGFGSVDVSGAPSDQPEGHWAASDARLGEPDFANVLPGGELDGLHAITTEAEALKLASLAFWRLTGAGDG